MTSTWGCRSVARVALSLVAVGLLQAPAAFGDAYYVNVTSDDAITAGCPTVTESTVAVPGDLTTQCSLRGAITLLNDNNDPDHPDVDYIQPVSSGPYYVGTPLPPLRGIFIEGGHTKATEPGEVAGVVHLVGGDHGQGANFPGIELAGAYDDIELFSIHGFSDAVKITGKGALVEGVYAGLQPDGTVPAVPNTGDGVAIEAGATGAQIGEPYYVQPVWASGNQGWGVHIKAGATDNTLYSVNAGLDPTNSFARPNQLGGVLIEGDANAVGTTGDCGGDLRCTTSTISGNDGPGVVVGDGTSGNTIVHSTVGLDGGRDFAVPNTGDGIVVGGSTQKVGDGTSIGAVTVSGNGGNGIVLRGRGTRLENVAVGTDATRTMALPNSGNGVLSDDAADPVGQHTILSSVISGNLGSGVELRQSGSTILNTSIGRAGDLTSPLGNHLDGVRALRGPQQIGGFQDNTISSNLGSGVAVVSSLPGVVPAGIVAEKNHYADNGGLAIDLGGDGLTANGPETDAFPNRRQRAPMLTSASSGGGLATYHGVADIEANRGYRVEIYKSAACDPSGFGEGQQRVNEGAFSSPTAGSHFFTALPTQVDVWKPGDILTAVLVDNQNGNTSEMSNCVTVTSGVDLAVDQRVSDASVTQNRDFELVTGVKNHGEREATKITVTVTVPATLKVLSTPPLCDAPADNQVRCALDDLAPGARSELKLLLVPTTSGALTTRVTVAADEVDVKPDDNTSELTFQAAGDGSHKESGVDSELGPVFAKSLRVDPVGGAVSATLPSGRSFNLTTYALVPVGTEVDATGGQVKVTAAQPAAVGGTTSGVFQQGEFRLRQPGNEKGLTEARMNSALSCDKASSRATAKKKRRHVWGTVKGKWRIRGRYATAAVRGTKWRVLDTCTSTEVFVREGVVRADALYGAKPAAKTLRAGQRAVFRRAKKK